MNHEEQILKILENLQAGQSATNARLDKMDARLDKVDARLDRLEAEVQTVRRDVETLKGDVGTLKGDVETLKGDVAWTRVTIEAEIRPNIQLLAEGHTAIVEKMATKEDIDALRDDLSLQKFRIDVIAEHIPT